MKNSDELNIDILNAPRKRLITDSLVGHNLELVNGSLTPSSKESLSKVGLTSIEIEALEQKNKTTALRQTLKIPQDNIPSSHNNPFTKENFNLDMQRKLHDTDAVLYRKLAQEAGLIQ